MRFLDEQYFQTPFYGLERLLVLLRLSGYRINRKRLRRLMGLVGWQTLFPGKRTSIADDKSYKYPYLLDNLLITHPNQVWAIDITYTRTSYAVQVFRCSAVSCTCLPSLTFIRVT